MNALAPDGGLAHGLAMTMAKVQCSYGNCETVAVEGSPYCGPHGVCVQNKDGIYNFGISYLLEDSNITAEAVADLMAKLPAEYREMIAAIAGKIRESKAI